MQSHVDKGVGLVHLSGKGRGRRLSINEYWVIKQGTTGEVVAVNSGRLAGCSFVCFGVCLCALIYLSSGSVCLWLDRKEVSGYVMHRLSHNPLVQAACCIGGVPAAGSGHWAKQCTKGSGQSRNAESQAAHSPLFTFLLIKLACVIGLLRFTSDLLHTHVLASPPTNTADGLCVPHFTQWVLKR